MEKLKELKAKVQMANPHVGVQLADWMGGIEIREQYIRELELELELATAASEADNAIIGSLRGELEEADRAEERFVRVVMVLGCVILLLFGALMSQCSARRQVDQKVLEYQKTQEVK